MVMVWNHMNGKKRKNKKRKIEYDDIFDLFQDDNIILILLRNGVAERKVHESKDSLINYLLIKFFN